jgi:hypothetical protein
MATTVERRASRHSSEDETSRPSEDGEKKALIIGISEYDDNEIQSLGFCRNDGEKIYEILKSISYKIPENYKLVGRVQFETMRDTIYDFFDNANTKADDTLIFYYSGHGVPDTDGDVYLATSEIDPDSPYRRGFSFNELTRMMNNSPSTKIVTILDCCYSGAAKISKGIGKGGDDAAAKLGTAAINDKSTKLQKNKGMCILAASQAAQEAYALKEGENSIFTYYLLEGLRGNEKSVDTFGNVTADSLGKYVHRAILNLPQDKRPKQTPIRKVEEGDEIILAHYPNLENRPTEENKFLLEKSCFFIAQGGKDNKKIDDHPNDVFHQVVAPAAKECNYEIDRGDLNSEMGIIVTRLLEHLYNDEFAIADLTGDNPYVVYQIGICHAFRKHVIQIKNSSESSSAFNLPGTQTIYFDLNDKDKIEKCKIELVRQIKNIESKTMPLALTLPPDIEMVNGEKEVLDFLNKHKRQTKDEYCAMWITDEYDRESLTKYYSEEARIGIDNIIRLINTKLLDKEMIRDHIMMFKDDICSGKYSIFSTTHSDYEIAICHKNRRKNDIMAILLFPDNLNGKVDLAIYSTAPAFIDAVKTRFRDFQQQGKRFRIIKNDIENSIDSWIEEIQIAKEKLYNDKK